MVMVATEKLLENLIIMFTQLCAPFTTAHGFLPRESFNFLRRAFVLVAGVFDEKHFSVQIKGLFG